MRYPTILLATALMAASPLALTSAQAQPQYLYGAPGYRPPPPPPPGPGGPGGPRGPGGPGYGPGQNYGPGYRGGPPPQVQQGNAYGWRKKGGRVPRGQGYVVNDYRRYGLRQPPRGYHWVRSGNDYILAGITSGIISSIISATR